MAELLIVIGIIVVVLALAVPAFNVITGSKSTDAASNSISAFLARARSEAIGLQQERGVMFYIDPNTDTVNAVLVAKAPTPSGYAANVTLPDVFLDLISETDVLKLPRGVGIQFIDDGGANIANDRYIGFNTANDNPSYSTVPTLVKYGGVILFDKFGRLTSKTYGFRTHRTTIDPGNVKIERYTPMATLLYNVDPTFTPIDNRYRDVIPVDTNSAPLEFKVLKSQLGFVLFDADAYKNAGEGDPLGDPRMDWQVQQPNSSYSGSFEVNKEGWLDQNSTPLLINRYSGALVKGE